LKDVADDHQDFIPRLKDHILGRYNDIPFDGEDHTFSDEERDRVSFVANRIYKHDVLHINYTTYDLRRAQDSINVRTHPYVMTLGHEDKEGDTTQHPYWYAKILGIFHVNVRLLDHTEIDRVEFLWVHWFGREPGHEGGFESRRLHRIGLIDSKDSTSYGFINPRDILRGVHLIPAFSENLMVQERDVDDEDNNSDDDDDDTENPDFYYVSMYAINEPLFFRIEIDMYPGLSIGICS
jgi:hypothetical protein